MSVIEKLAKPSHLINMNDIFAKVTNFSVKFVVDRHIPFI